MTQKSSDLADLIPYSERVDKTRVPAANDFIIEQHVPALFDVPYHHHTSIEINFLQDCEMTYSFSGSEARLQPGCMTVFWGAAPHRVTAVAGKGLITNIYLSLGQFVRWGLPTDMVDSILTGAVISTTARHPLDDLLFQRLYAEHQLKSAAWTRIHLDEIETRLRRLAVTGWSTLLAPRHTPNTWRSPRRQCCMLKPCCAIWRTILRFPSPSRRLRKRPTSRWAGQNLKTAERYRHQHQLNS
ncbi:MAG: hypothetical protein R3E89_18650 [Thiolinea sp.]